MSTYEDQVYALRTAEFAADGDECVRRDDAARIARAADAEIAKLRTENAALQNEARQIWAQVPDGYKLSSGARPLEAIRLMVKGLWAMSEELRALRAENASLDRIATDYYERLTGEAQEEIARLQSGIAALREQWQARRDKWEGRGFEVVCWKGKGECDGKEG